MSLVGSDGEPGGEGGQGPIGPLLALGALTLAVLVAVGGRYGFHRDELATLEDARHLAWGYVAYPPMTPFFGRLSLELFGTSLRGFRFFAALAEAVAVVLTGLMARELGGGPWAQAIAALAALPFSLAAGVLMQYVSFDYLAWVATTFVVVRLLRTGDRRLFVALGATIGLGMLSKYAMPFLVAGVAVGFLATGARRHLPSPYLVGGVLLALLVFLPNLLWQVRHDFVSLEFLRSIHARDVRIGRADHFLRDQLLITSLGAPLWIAGLLFYLVSSRGRPYRALAFLYLVPLGLFLVARGRGYYLVGVYPVLYAGGAAWIEGALRASSRRRLVLRAIALSFAANAVGAGALSLPLAPVNTRWWGVTSELRDDFPEEIGWPELVGTVARIRDAVPAAERPHLGILAANYGEAGALNLYGPAYGLPRVVSGVNSFWGEGYPSPPPETLIVVGHGEAFLSRTFASCTLAGKNENALGVRNEETREHPNLYVCRGLLSGWPEFWKGYRHFG
jgi:4-amino-4-deoxy-L-arabinose transferase-like glycosyltransferase